MSVTTVIQLVVSFALPAGIAAGVLLLTAAAALFHDLAEVAP